MEFRKEKRQIEKFSNSRHIRTLISNRIKILILKENIDLHGWQINCSYCERKKSLPFLPVTFLSRYRPMKGFLTPISTWSYLHPEHQAQHLVCCSRLGADAFLNREQKLYRVNSWLTCSCLRRTLRRCARQWTSACWRIRCGATSEPVGEQSSRPLEYLRVIIYERYETRFLQVIWD